MTDWRIPDPPVDLGTSIELTDRAADRWEKCPECGKDYVDLDTTLRGSLVVIHRESPLTTCKVPRDDPSVLEGDDGE